MDDLAELTARAVAAVRGRDMPLLDGLLAPEFTLTTGRPGAEVRTRAEWLQITATRYVVHEEAIRDLSVTALAADAAVVRYRLTQRATLDGAERSGAFRVTDCWSRREREWRLVARHSTAVPASGAERLRVRPERLSLVRTEGTDAPLRADLVRGRERTTVASGAAGEWRALEVQGPLDLALTGVLARLSAVLAAAGVPLFALSTYDTDLLLVRAAHLEQAVAALTAAGHEVLPSPQG